MSVIGYLITCGQCEIKMVVTAEARHSRMCPDCLREYVLDAVDHLPPEQVVG